MLMESTEIKPEDVEIILLPCSSKPIEARFLISLSVDLSQLQIRTCKSESDVAILLIIFSGADWSRITPQLDISKSLEKIFSGTGALYLPYFVPDTCLTHYVSNIKRYIAAKVFNLC